MNNVRNTDWRNHVQQLQNEAGGCLSTQVITLDDVPLLLAGRLAGEPKARATLRIVNDTLRRIQSAPRHRPMLCGSCPRPLTRGKYSVVIARAARDEPQKGLTFAICHRCGTTHATVEAAAVKALARIWPGTRPVRVTHPEGGRA